MQKQMDVVIPSYRLNEKILLNIFSLPAPNDLTVSYFLVADNPDVVLPASIKDMAEREEINLLVNQTNLGFSKTRNKGIHAGSSPWILLLDDDIVPESSLLQEYARAIDKNLESIGFIGVTDFPKPFNNVTAALEINEATSHFNLAKKQAELSWAPTANVVLNRQLLGSKEFDNSLFNGGEDIELLTRNAFENNQKYLSVPHARVVHPWWNDGKPQLKRMFQYGKGSADIIGKKHIATYSYYDFTNTSETIFLLLLCFLASLLSGFAKIIFIELIAAAFVAEFITNIIRSVVLSKRFSLSLAWQMMIHKNATEVGALTGHLANGKLQNFAKRLDVGFTKKHPSPFRLNRWKIIKLVITALMILFLYWFY